MVVVALIAITAGAIMLRTAFAPIPDPRVVISTALQTGTVPVGPNPIGTALPRGVRSE